MRNCTYYRRPNDDREGWGGGLQKKFFEPLGPQFGLKIRASGGKGGRPPGTSPGSSTAVQTTFLS